ncbi:Oidioi.mRNA.OKI2018_I69.chr1.g1934.t1.cds [Oikopleura dioica]|uniref:Oidioi.mRNA.OKI2018_I69.chr1.g1934.t1.cds n=1 Tax=Oikopleura dioica TaxID=34765 RepID=A0ABN7SPI3_OIKDI|nr:Oidioi.mRNA.OKI2018_I69.chr1.g1934.t1.cds [Oikopleura dioica]
MADKEKTGSELAAQRVRQRKLREKKQREILLQQQNKADTDDKKLIGQLKAAQSQNRTVELRNKVNTAISEGLIESIENQTSARAALRLEALLIDPVKEHNYRTKAMRELKSIMTSYEQYKCHRIMSDDHWGERNL